MGMMPRYIVAIIITIIIIIYIIIIKSVDLAKVIFTIELAHAPNNVLTHTLIDPHMTSIQGRVDFTTSTHLIGASTTNAQQAAFWGSMVWVGFWRLEGRISQTKESLRT